MQEEKISCKDFGEIRARLKVRNDHVTAHYALDGVPVDGYYVLRLWPEGRHMGEPRDFVIGQLEAGSGASGDFPSWQVPGIEAKEERKYNLDVDVFPSEDGYRKSESLGQCDRGGTITLQPPPAPAAARTNGGGHGPAGCEEHPSTITGSGCYEEGRVVTVRAQVTASNFAGEVVIVDMARRQRLETVEIDAPCGETTNKTLTWTGSIDSRRELLALCGFDETGRMVLDVRIPRC